MANTTISPNMQLPVPVVGEDAGPDYADNVNNCLTLVDQHDHSPGYGVQITPSGIDINGDLSMQANNLVLARSVRFSAQGSPLAGASDLGCLYESGVDLYYNDGIGNQVRITQSGGVAGSPGSIANLTSPASASYVSANETFVWQSAASTPANMDGASYILRNLVANSKGLTLAPPAAMASDYSLTLPTLPGVKNIMMLDSSGAISAALNVDGSSLQISGNILSIASSGVTTAKIADQAVTQGKLALRTTGVTVAAGGVAVSVASSAHNTTSTSFVDIPNLTVTITTTGRPVRMAFNDDGSGTAAFVEAIANTPATFRFLRDTTPVLAQALVNNTTSNIGYPASSISGMDFPAAGTYTYKAQWKVSSGQVLIDATKLIVYEI